MPAIGREVASPFHPSNFAVPNRLSMWFAPIDSRGVQGEFIELGDVANISVDLTETYVDKKSARFGVFNTVKRAIAGQEGAIDFAISELVNSNLDMLYRPSQTILRDDVANAEAVLYDQTRPRLNGEVASEIAPGLAVESGPGGTLYSRELTLLSVKNLNGSVTYALTTDYTFTQAVEGEQSAQLITVGGATVVAGNSIALVENDGSTTTLVADTHFDASAVVGTLRDNIVRAINAYSSSYVATAQGADEIVLANIRLDGSTAPAVVVTGAELIADLGGASLTFSAGVATTPATIARVATGSIPDGGEVVVKFTYNRRGVERTIQTGLILEGALRLQVLSTSGPQAFYEFPRVSMEIGAALTVNPEEFQMATMKATILTGGDGVRGRYTQLCTFSDFFVEAASTACPAAPIAATPE